MAMERLLELSEEPTTNLVVLDTPPAREALDFLDAPRRLLDLLNSRAVTLLGGGMRRGFSVVDLAARAVLSAFDRLTGLHLLGDVQAFVRSFDGMYAGFAERAARVQQLLVAGDTAVVVVTTAEPERIAQAHEFLAALRTAGIEPRAVIVNRTLPAIASAEQIARAPLAPALRRKLIARGRGVRGAASARSRRDSVAARGRIAGTEAARDARPRTRAGRTCRSRLAGAESRDPVNVTVPPRIAIPRGRDRWPVAAVGIVSRGRRGPCAGAAPDAVRGPPDGELAGLVRLRICGGPGVARRGHLVRRQHPVDLHAKVDQLAGQRIEPGLQLADVAFGRDVDEVENGLDVAIEDVLVGHQSFSRASQPLAHPFVGHQLAHHAPQPFLAHLAQL